MTQTKAMKTEMQLNALFEFECAKQGCRRLAYPPVVAGGIASTTLHYIHNDDILRTGDLILMDAGGEYHDYVSDITRTWPVSGKFTDEQKEVYAAVLEIQKYSIQFAVPGSSLELMYKESVTKTIQILKRLGLRQFASIEGFHKLFPHDISHFLGMDLHDTHLIKKDRKLQPGFVCTVEPGLYFGDEDDIPKKFRNIGIRIEDDVLVTDKGPEILSRRTPKSIEEIERQCNIVAAITV
jgi:Xaa-Pro aminopeptidase